MEEMIDAATSIDFTPLPTVTIAPHILADILSRIDRGEPSGPPLFYSHLA